SDMRPVRSARRRRALALIATAAICAGLALPAPQPTEASWVDTEAGSATFTALTVTAPTYVGCAGSGLLSLGETLTIHWRAAPNADQLTVEYEYVDQDGLLQ